MEESLKVNDMKNQNIYNIENNNLSNIQIITNIAINQSLGKQNTKSLDLNNENKNEIDENYNNDKLGNSLEDIITDNLREHSAIVSKINSRNDNNRINISLKDEKQGTYNKRLTKENYSYLNRFIDYEKRKEMKIAQMQKIQNENEKKKLKKKPAISRKSVELISRMNLNDDILERMNDEEKKTKDKKEKLIQKINKEREKRKKEIEKPNQFNIKTTKFDNKFDKVYNEMMRKEENIKSKINAFADMVQKYEMRECVFQPNLYKYNNKKYGNNKIKRRVSSCDITKRLYDEEIKNRRNRINKLNEKYKLTFKPKISNKSVDLALKRREKIKLLSKEDTKEEDDNSNSNNIKK